MKKHTVQKYSIEQAMEQIRSDHARQFTNGLFTMLWDKQDEQLTLETDQGYARNYIYLDEIEDYPLWEEIPRAIPFLTLLLTLHPCLDDVVFRVKSDKLNPNVWGGEHTYFQFLSDLINAYPMEEVEQILLQAKFFYSI